MSANNHTPITLGAAANAATINNPLGQLDAAVGNLTTLATTAKTSAVAAINELKGTVNGVVGGANISNAQLLAWADGEAYELLSITYSPSYPVVSTATVKWPDGSGGTFTATTINATFQAIDAYTITHTSSGKTVTQSSVTRDGDGLVTVKPAIVIS